MAERIWWGIGSNLTCEAGKRGFIRYKRHRYVCDNGLGGGRIMGQLTWWAANGLSMVHHTEVRVGLVSDIVYLFASHATSTALPSLLASQGL